MSPTLVILAAGHGRRFGGLKQVAAVGPAGELILDYAVYDALCAGCEHVVFVVQPGAIRLFQDLVATRFSDRIAVDYVEQHLNDLPHGIACPTGRDRPWGTGHALLAAADVVPASFVMVNADDLYGPQAYADAFAFLTGSTHADHAVIGYPIGPTLSESGAVSRAVCRCSADGRLADIEELERVIKEGEGGLVPGTHRRLAAETPVSMNMWAFRPTVFDALRSQFTQFLSETSDLATAEFQLPSAIRAGLHDGMSVQVIKAVDSWCGMTHASDQAEVSSFIRTQVEAGVYPEALWT